MVKRFCPANGNVAAPLLAAVLTLAYLAGLGSARAQVDADPRKDYAITPEVGPWTICAASFMGEDAQMHAHNLVLELRTRCGLPAYVFNHGAEERRAQQAELDQQRQQQRRYLESLGLHPDNSLPLRHVRIEDQYAVLIGGYPDIDAAHRELERIKKLARDGKLELQSVPPEGAAQGVRIVDIFVPQKPATEPHKEASGDQKRELGINPLWKSFVVRNPTVPCEHNRDLSFLKDLNRDESYSLLNCRKHWTLMVRSFQGTVIVPEKMASGGFWEKLGLGGHDLMTASAKQAHELAKALREMKEMHFDAYVLHTKYGSLVTVGGFDSEKDPQLLQTQKCLANLRLQIAGGGMLQFNPVLMEIPRP
jgi:hypothetical protein